MTASALNQGIPARCRFIAVANVGNVGDKHFLSARFALLPGIWFVKRLALAHIFPPSASSSFHNLPCLPDKRAQGSRLRDERAPRGGAGHRREAGRLPIGRTPGGTRRQWRSGNSAARRVELPGRRRSRPHSGRPLLRKQLALAGARNLRPCPHLRC